MCGIAGFIGNIKIKDRDITKTLEIMKNRGPNSKGVSQFYYKKNSIYLLHTRLKIIDLSNRSNQPFVLKDNILIFNGEIYNYIEIKKKLLNLGYKFKTNSDTEVVLVAYMHYGENCVKYFEGMWALVIWDHKRKKLFFSRDRFGEKPLFYYRNSNGLYFGSETKYIQSLSGLKFEPNPNIIKKHISLGYRSIFKTNETYFKKIFSFANSSYAYLNNDFTLNTKRYWNVELKEDNSLSFEDVCENTKFLINKSIKEKLQSDVPVALSLSGGIDSSIIAGVTRSNLNKNIKCFSLIDKGKYNEKKNILRTSKFLNLRTDMVNIDYKNFLFNLREVIKYQNEPIQTINYFAQNFLMQKVKNANYKVILSGTGADEIFTGYYNHFLQFFSTIKNTDTLKKNIDDWKKSVLPIIRNKSLKDPLRFIKNPKDRDNIYDNHSNMKNILKYNLKSKFKEKKFTKNLLRNRMYNELFYETTPITLRHEDLNSMQYSIENRSPFLDSKIYEFANTIPTKYLIKNGYQKYILRKSFENVLDRKVSLNRNKVGFNASLDFFIKNEKIQNINKFLDKKSPLDDLINMKKFKNLIMSRNFVNNQKFIFNIINLKLFLEIHE